jgi:phosphatidylglycerol lysyltransferase
MNERLKVLERYSPINLSHAGHLASALAGFALIMLSTYLWRRKRIAWILAEVILVISGFNHLFKGLDYEEALLSLALAAWLLFLRPHFHARSDPPSVRQGLITLVGALLFTIVYGVTGFYLLDRHFKVNFGLSAALRQTIMMFTQFSNPGLEPITGFGRYFADSIYAVSAVTLGYSFWMLVRPVLVRGHPHPSEHQHAQEIVEKWGHSSLARYTLFNDKLYFFSKGNTLFAFAIRHRIALVLGDPIGPPDDLRAAMKEFAEFCAGNDWIPAYYQVLPENLEIYKDAGYDALCIGHEGIVNLSTFTIAGGENKSIRTSFNRLVKLSFIAEFVAPPHPRELLNELSEISEEWLTHMNGSEKRFSLGWFDFDYLNSCTLVIVRNPNGRVDAFANIIPEYQANEASVDLMGRRATTENGLMDFLFISMLQWAKDKGYQTFNLGLSSLSGIGENPKDPAIERALHYIYEHVNQFYNFKGLHEFKNKYHPTWSPRYMIYPGLTSLPAVTIAMMLADSSDDWLGGFIRKT